METQTVEFRSPPSQTTTAKLFTVGSDTEQASVAATEATNRKGTYLAAFTDEAAGEYELIAFVGVVPVARWFVTLTLTTATFQAYDKARAVLDSTARVKLDAIQTDYAPLKLSDYTAPANSTIASIYALVQLIDSDVSTMPSDVRDAILNRVLAGNHDTTGTAGRLLQFLSSVLLAQNSNERTVQVTDSNHIAADVHNVQPDGLTASDDVAELVLWTHRIAATTAGKANGAGTSTETFLIDGVVQVVISLDVDNNRTNVVYTEL